MIVLLRYGKITTFDVKFQVEPFLIPTKFQQNQIIIILLKIIAMHFDELCGVEYLEMM